MGEALGVEIEFWKLKQIRTRFPGGRRSCRRMTEGQGGINDDTQMTLSTAEGLIRALVRRLAGGICAPEGVVHHAPLRWHRTQGGVPRMEIRDRDLAQCHGLARHPATPRRRCRNLSADTAPMLVG